MEQQPLPAHKMQIIGADGTRTTIEAVKIIIELGPRKEIWLRVDKDKPDNKPASLLVGTDCDPNDRTHWSSLVVRPRCANGIEIEVELDAHEIPPDRNVTCKTKE